MTEDRSEQQDQPSRPERRGERRIKLKPIKIGFTHFGTGKKGQITEMEMNYRIAKGMVASDLLKDRANKKHEQIP